MMLEYLVVLAGAATALAASHGPNAAGFTLARCLEKDDAGGMLLHHSKTRNKDGDFVVCRYKKAGLCEYFTPNGEFSSGASTCPDSIRPAEAPPPPPETDNNSAGGAPGGANLATCVPADDDGGKLLHSGTVQEDGDLLVVCTYEKAGACAYFAAIGESSSGSSVCPDSITPPALSGSGGGSDDNSGADNGVAESDLADNNSASSGAGSANLATCVPADDDGGKLLSSDTVQDDGDLLVECTYEKAGACAYFAAIGESSSGSSVCPDSITPPALPGSDGSDNDSSGAENSVTASVPGSTSSLATCPPTDGAGSPLTGSAASNSADSTVACQYQAAGQCVYFAASGAFSSGSSDCPDSIPAAASSSGSAPAGDLGSFLADDASSGGGGGGSTATPPVLIALLVMNGLLVLGILTILFLWVRDRRAGAGAASGRKGRYTPVNTNTARDEFSIPVATRGGYYDAQEKS